MGTKLPNTPVVVTGHVFAAKRAYSTSWLKCTEGDLVLAQDGYRRILERDGVIDPSGALAAVGELAADASAGSSDAVTPLGDDAAGDAHSEDPATEDAGEGPPPLGAPHRPGRDRMTRRARGQR